MNVNGLVRRFGVKGVRLCVCVWWVVRRYRQHLVLLHELIEAAVDVV